MVATIPPPQFWYLSLVFKVSMSFYTDVYHALVDCVVQDLKNGTYKLNCRIVAIVELTPRVIVHFTLQNVSNNHSKMWTTVLVGETIVQLTTYAWNQIERYKEELS